MRLFEIAPTRINSQAGVLMTIMQHLQSKGNISAGVPVAKVVKLMNNLGYPISDDDVDGIINSTPGMLDFQVDPTTKTIKLTNQPEPSIGDGNEEDDSAEHVDAMASKAAKSNLA